MSFYARMLDTANRLINKYGKAAVIVTESRSGSAHNPTVSETLTDCTFVEINDKYSLTLVDRSLVQQGDKVGLIAATATPTLEARLRTGGSDYRFTAIEPLNPGGTVLLYEILARK